jgi:uncharacterized membrane protein (UPF0127 family)
MAQKTNKSNKKKKQQAAKKNRHKWIRIIVMVLAVLVILLFMINPWANKRTDEHKPHRTEVPFTKEGELTFYQANTKIPITTIEIEIADNYRETMRGLMFRYKMDMDKGMYFIMEREEPQAFWMKNTYISLDTIYLNRKKQIVSIAKNTIPESIESLPSGKKAKYVVEVNAGFCDQYGIKVGDYIGVQRSN